MRRHQHEISCLLEIVRQLARRDSMTLLAYIATMALEENKENADSASSHDAPLGAL
ncbi:hypothetical protein [Shinella sp. G-2]|uniref:hypothetical protein n=1 Tax=Shinella sp. G-2 TaxID=3133141 RepID=UPI003CFF3F01